MSEVLLDALRRAGFRGRALKTAYAVAMAESGGDPRALNDRRPDLSYGLFQINMIDELGPDRRKRYGLASNDDLYDPYVNARVAFRLSRGGRDWTPWTTYTSGAYQQHLDGLPKRRGGAAVVAGAPTSGPGTARGPSEQAAPAPRYGDYLQALGIQQDAPALDQPAPDPRYQEYFNALGISVEQAREAATAPRTTTAAKTRKTAKAKRGALAPGGGWGGSYNPARTLARVGRQHGLKVWSEKRETKHTASGGVSDHWVGSKNAYAFDLSNGDSPTPEMDAAAREIARMLGVDYDGRSELVLTKTIGGYRYQVLYRTSTGGNHFQPRSRRRETGIVVTSNTPLRHGHTWRGSWTARATSSPGSSPARSASGSRSLTSRLLRGYTRSSAATRPRVASRRRETRFTSGSCSGRNRCSLS